MRKVDCSGNNDASREGETKSKRHSRRKGYLNNGPRRRGKGRESKPKVRNSKEINRDRQTAGEIDTERQSLRNRDIDEGKRPNT